MSAPKWRVFPPCENHVWADDIKDPNEELCRCGAEYWRHPARDWGCHHWRPTKTWSARCENCTLERSLRPVTDRTSERGKMTDERLKEIQERLDKATPGEWTASNGRGKYGVLSARRDTGEAHPLAVFAGIPAGQRKADSELCAHSREDIPFLLAEIERLTRVITEAVRLTDEYLEDEDSLVTDDPFTAGTCQVASEIRAILQGES